MRAIDLKTEYLIHPLGLGIRKPRLMWKAEDGIEQTAYHVVTEKWDSGIVESSSMKTEYPLDLESREVVHWKVSLRDENNEWSDYTESFFEMGLLNPSDFAAKWISGNISRDKKRRDPVDCFRKEFKANKVVKARLYATAKGIYDVTLNGQHLEDFILAPGSTDYRKRIQVQTYDITNLIKEDNTIEVGLADGWYRGSVAAYGFTEAYGTDTSFYGQIELIDEDGNRKTIISDGSWDWCNDGPIRFSDLKDGEKTDTTFIPSYDKKAKEVKAPKNVLLCMSDNVPVKKKEELSATLLKNNVLDFGQNIAGVPAFKVKGNKGDKIRLVCGEILDENGNVTLKNIQDEKPAKGWSTLSLIRKLMTGKVSGETALTPLQEIEYICNGEEETYCPKFTVFGFRYVQVFTDLKVIPADYKAIAIYSDMEVTGSFSCSDEAINRLYLNTLWSMKSNYLDVPTDCPTRERLGWTGDAQIFFNAGAYMMNTAPFFRKWLRDMEDSQYKDGVIPAIFPYSDGEMIYKNTGASVGWADAIYLIPYRYYRMFGDENVLEDSFPMMKKYCDYLLKHLGQKDKKAAKENPYNQYTYEKGMHLGEWLEPEQFQEKISSGHRPVHTEEATAYLHLTMKTMSEICHILNKEDLAKQYEEIAEGSKKAYERFAELDTDRQAKLVRPLALGLLDGELKKKVQKRLIQSAVNNNYHVGTGFLSTPFLLDELAKTGEVDVAYKTLLNKEKPGWLYEIEKGATSIWETWEGELSQNHYSPGAVCEWLYSGCAGIKIAGENCFELSPLPGTILEHAEATYDSVYGKVVSEWKRKGNTIEFKFTVPANTTATITLPDGRSEKVCAGTYEYSLKEQ